MKRTSFILALLLTANFAFAQKSNTAVKIIAGVTLPKFSVSSNNTDNRKIYMGYTAGISLNTYKKSNDGVGLILGVNYLQAGAINPKPALVGATESKERLNYISGDAMLGFKIESAIKIEIFGGGYMAKLLNGDYNTSMATGSNQKGSFKIGTKSTDDFIALDLGFKFGMCFNIKKVSVGIVLQQGLMDIDTKSDTKMHNQIYAFTLGYSFGK